MQRNEVILVDENNVEIGSCEKLEAHKSGLLHRAFSIFLINDEGEILLQQRAATKYHSASLWSNSCCSHPAPNESILEAATRRLQEELNVQVPVKEYFHFKYFVAFENGLIEHEIDHVLFGKLNFLPSINPEEAMNYRWITLENLKEEIKKTPSSFTFWCQYLLENYYDCLKIALHENL